MAGALAMSMSYIVAVSAILLIWFYWLAAKEEEANLVKQFPEYAQYMATTGMFVPRIIKSKPS